MAGRCSWCTASPARRRTSPTGSTRWPSSAGTRSRSTTAATARARSRTTSPQYSFDLLAADALALADDRWGPGSRFVLLGHSMGGMVAQVIAMRAADRLDGLVLMDTGHGRLSFIDREQAMKVVAIVEDRGIDGLADSDGGPRSDRCRRPAHERLLAEREGYAEFGDRKLRATASAAYAGMLTAMVDADRSARRAADRCRSRRSCSSASRTRRCSASPATWPRPSPARSSRSSPTPGTARSSRTPTRGGRR